MSEKQLEQLRSVPPEKILTIGTRRYFGAATVAQLLGKTPQTISIWCRRGIVFREVHRVPEAYKPAYLIPVEEVERVIREQDFPRRGNPAFATGQAYPYPNRRQKRGKPVKEAKAETVTA
jgi:hypothetical protein